MNPEAAKAGLGIALFVVVAALLVLPFEPAGSAEFVVTLLALAVGLAGTALIAYVIRRMAR